jgi:hypothetical protein
MEQARPNSSGQFIYLSRKSKLARVFQDAPASVAAVAQTVPPQVTEIAPVEPAVPCTRVAKRACPKLQAVFHPALELSRPLAAALMREQAELRCRARGVLLDNEYVPGRVHGART